MRKLLALSGADWLLLVAAVLALAVARIAVALLPFSVIARLLGLRKIDPGHVSATTRDARAARVGWAIRSAVEHTPWQSTCLVEALAGAALLRRSGISSMLSLGVARDGSSQRLIAHAWLRCGDEVLTGQTEPDRFAELASFAIG